MSDLQDLIARNAVMAYNEGLERGATIEQERIVQLVKDDYARVAKKNGYVFLPEQIDWLVDLIERQP